MEQLAMGKEQGIRDIGAQGFKSLTVYKKSFKLAMEVS
jgi:hypothetical protein